jgi:hypothetical protein
MVLNYQKNYECLFDKKISLENCFLTSMYHGHHINLIKIGIIKSYDINESNKLHVTNNTPVKSTNARTKNKTKKKISKPQRKHKQQSLDGIAPIRRVM